MKLYYNGASPFARKAAALTHEIGLAGAVELVAVAGSPTGPASLLDAENPLGKIPSLIRESGPAIYDSRTICRFLDDHAAAGMYPAPPALWETLTLEATADGIMDAAVLMIYEVRCRDEAIRSTEWVEAQWSKVERALDAIAGRWTSHLAGNVDMGHIAIACALGYLDLRHPDRNWSLGREALAQWFAEFSTRESMQKTAPFIPWDSAACHGAVSS